MNLWFTLLLFFTGVFLGYLAWDQFDRTRVSLVDSKNSLKIVQLKGEILHYDEILTMSARMAATTGDLVWEKRYNNYVPKLDLAIKDAIRLAKRHQKQSYVKQTDEANLKLVELETQAFNLVRIGNLKGARKILFSSEYEDLKKIYSEGMNALIVTASANEQLQATIGSILYFDEVLTMSTEMAAATGDLTWERRYRKFESKLENALGEAKSILPEIMTSEDIEKTNVANQALVKLENQSFNLIKSGKRSEATRVLNSREYLKQKQIYKEGMEQLRSTMQSVIEADHQSSSRSMYIRSVLIFLTITLIFVGWFRWSRMSRDLRRTRGLLDEVERLKTLQDTVLESSVEGIYGLDIEGRTTFVNGPGAKLLGYSPEEMIGKPQHALIHYKRADGSDYPRNECPIYATFGGGSASFVDDEVFWRKDGTSFPVEYTSTPIRDEKGKVVGAVVVFRDVSQQREMKNQVFHASKLAEIGTLAAGVGHEINNPVAIAMGNVDKIEKEIRSAGIKVPSIERAIQNHRLATSRIVDIVNGLRTLARQDINEFKAFDLGEAVLQTLGLIKEIYRKDGVVLELKNEKGPFIVEGSQGRTQQALLNLVSNARDALDGSSVKEIDVCLSRTEKEIVLSVRDTGPGIPKEVQSKMFETFFTTKEIGKGTGMGLSLTSSIMREQKGRIEFDSSSEGTAFRLVFPAIDAKSSPQTEKEIAQVIPIKSKKRYRVLVADDEELIRELISEMLTDLNCEVTEARDGQEALDCLKKTNFDFIFTDMKMPRVDGLELLRKIHEMNLNPRPKLYAITGGVKRDFTKEGAKEIRSLMDGFIQKPFQADVIAKIISGAAEEAA